jgi:hypothetical protein
MNSTWRIPGMVLLILCLSMNLSAMTGESPSSAVLLSNTQAALKADASLAPFAIYVNPLGVLQFGPMFGVEIKLADNMLLNLNSRLPRYGLLSYVVRGWDGVDRINGISFGVVPILFFTENQNKPYVGVGLEYDRTKVLYSEGYSNENTETENNFVMVTNGGYRWRFDSGFYMTTGLYLGFALDFWEEVHVSSYFEDDSGVNFQPFGMFELKLGFEF